MMLGIFAAIAALFFLAERFWPLRKQPVLRQGFLTDCIYVPMHYLMRTILNGTVAVAVSEFGQRLLPAYSINVLRDKPVWLQAVTVLVVLDFIFYVTHRLKHRWLWWWRLHETHHSSADLDWLASVRFHPLEKILDRTIYLFPLLFFGASETAVLIWAGVDVFFGMFNHSNLRWRIGPFIHVFVGPEMHLWHHTRAAERRECNYGNNLSIFDWIFDTAYLPCETPSEFGIPDCGYPHGNIVKQFFYAFRPAHRESRAVATSPQSSEDRAPA